MHSLKVFARGLGQTPKRRPPPPISYATGADVLKATMLRRPSGKRLQKSRTCPEGVPRRHRGFRRLLRTRGRSLTRYGHVSDDIDAMRLGKREEGDDDDTGVLSDIEMDHQSLSTDIYL